MEKLKEEYLKMADYYCDSNRRYREQLCAEYDGIQERIMAAYAVKAVWQEERQLAVKGAALVGISLASLIGILMFQCMPMFLTIGVSAIGGVKLFRKESLREKFVALYPEYEGMLYDRNIDGTMHELQETLGKISENKKEAEKTNIELQKRKCLLSRSTEASFEQIEEFKKLQNIKCKVFNLKNYRNLLVQSMQMDGHCNLHGPKSIEELESYQVKVKR